MRILAMLLLLTLAVPASAQLLTKDEINSALPSQDTYSRAEVIDLIYGYGEIFNAKWQALRAQLIAENDARFANYIATFQAELRGLQLENTLVWIGVPLVGIGLLIYGIFKADPGSIIGGVAMAGSGVIRLVIYLNN